MIIGMGNKRLKFYFALLKNVPKNNNKMFLINSIYIFRRENKHVLKSFGYLCGVLFFYFCFLTS